MTMRPEAESDNEEKDLIQLGERLEVGYPKSTRIRVEDMESRGLEFYDQDDRFIGVLKLNGIGNHKTVSYTFRYWNGAEVLVPSHFIDDVHSPLVSPSIRFIVDPRGNLLFRRMKEGSGCRYELWDQLEEEDFRDFGQGIEPLKEVPAGERGVLKGTLSGGREYLLSTHRILGDVKETYVVNDDSVCVGEKHNRLVLLDGVGGYKDGYCVAHYAGRLLALYDGTLAEACANARERVEEYVRFYDQAEKGDAVYVVAEFHGDQVEFVSTGDSRWLVIRDGKVLKKSQVRNVGAELLSEGVIREEQLYGDPEFLRMSAAYTTGLRSGEPDFDSALLKKGDRVVLISDGVDALTDKEIANIVSDKSTEQAYGGMADLIGERNVQKKYVRELSTGMSCLARAPLDNVSIGIYVHE